MSKRIYETLCGYGEKNIISFHMPGHKGKKFLNGDIFKLDITEIPGMDNLYRPEGIIKKSQEAAAKVYGAKFSFFLTGGGTAGILAAVLSCVSSGDKILAARNCHRSVISGIMLSGVEPLYVYPEITDGNISGGVCPEKVKAALEENKGVRAVVIVSPTYEGVVSDVKRISEITKRAGAYLIIDCAHGAHFPFSDKFPDYPDCADIVVSGLHKTLPFFGQCAIINVYNEKLAEKTASALAIVQTSSPSYLFLASIDKFFSDFERGIYPFKNYIKNLLYLREDLGRLKRIKLFSGELAGNFFIHDIDISRLVFLFDRGKPEKFAGILHEKYAIDIEAYYLSHATAISSVADTEGDLLALRNAVVETDKSWEYPRCGEKPALYPPAPAIVCTPRDAWGMPREYVDLNNCAGRVAAEVILTYPPGIAVIVPGEEISGETIRFLNYCLENKLSVHGICDFRVCVLKDCRSAVT